MKQSRKCIFIPGIIFIGLFLLFMITEQLFAPAVVGEVKDINAIQQSGKLRVVTENSSIGIQISGDSLSGFQYELLKAFADSINVELDITQNNDLTECIRGVKKGKYDIIVKFSPITTEHLSEGVIYSNPILTTQQMLVQRSNDSTKVMLSVQNQLANDTIYIPKNSPHKMRLQHLMEEIADTIYIKEVDDLTIDDLISMVSTGEIDYTICNGQLAKQVMVKYDNINATLALSTTQPYAWIVNAKSPALLEKLNLHLAGFINSPAYWNLYRKYY